jgi:diaminopimelate decarboxylase
LNAGSQFGMSREDLLWLVDHRDQYAHLHVVGIHYFVGTQRMKLKHQRDELAMLSALIDELQEQHGFAVERLEYGPGLGVSLFEGDDFSDTLAPARDLREALVPLAEKVELTVEMGRFFATECGTYLSAVNDLKAHDDINYCIIDGGINHLSYIGQIMGMKVPVITNESALERNDGAILEDAMDTWCICGSLCTTNDVITREVSLDDLREGDVLAFHNAGAYTVTEGYALFLSRTMPRVILKRADGGYELARDFIETSTLNTPFGTK